MYSIMHYIPLIGPFVLAQKKLEVEGHNFKSNGIYSFPCFADNEQHIEFNDSSKKVTYFEEECESLVNRSSDLQPWTDVIEKYSVPVSDIVTGVPPCAGLSMLNSSNSCSSKSRGADAVQNNWIFSALKFYLASDSNVLVLENAPGLATQGLSMIYEMEKIIKDNGLERKIQLVKTSTFHHGIPQNRSRTFLIIHKNKNYIRFKNKGHIYQSLEEFLNTASYKKDDPCFFNTDQSKGTKAFLELIENNPEIIEKFKAINGPCVKSSWKLFLPEIEKNPDMIKDYEAISKQYEHIKRKKAMGLGFWDGSPSFAKGHVNAVISKNKLTTFNPTDNYKSLLTVRHFMHLMGIPIDFDLSIPEKNWKHITQNVPVPTAADAILWACECLDGGEEMEFDLPFILNDNMKGDLYNTIMDPNMGKLSPKLEKDIFEL